MGSNSRYIRVHQDALIEYITDDSFFYEDEYSIVKDSLNGTSYFNFSKTAVNAFNYNKIPNQLYQIDGVINKFGIADPDEKTFLQEVKYTNNAPSHFDQVKIWLPIHWTFANLAGMYLKIWALNYENSSPLGLSNFYLDASIPSELNKLTTEAEPLRLYDKLWGKSITLYIPSVYYEALNRTNNAPTAGTINYNINNGQLGFSTTTPIFLDFRFLKTKSTVLGQTSFLTLPPLVTSLPQTPEYNNLSVQIVQADDGDYFKINGIYNGSIGEFDSFMTMLDNLGKRSYILYSITVFEETILQNTKDVYVYKDFFKGIDDYRPVLKFTNTTASIQVEMKLINSVNGSVISKLTNYSITGSEIGKYGKNVTPINITGSIKPKIYNSKPDNLILPNQSVINKQIKKTFGGTGTGDIKYIPYPVITNVANIVADQLNGMNKGETYLGLGGLTISLTPFDNIIKLKIAENKSGTIKPMTFPVSNSTIQLVFKSVTTELRIGLYLESNEVDLVQGILIFKINALDYNTLKKIFETNQNFYITITSNSIETSLYDGRFTLLEEIARIPSSEFTTDQINATNGTGSTNPINNTNQDQSNTDITNTSGSVQQQIQDANLTQDQINLIK